MNLADYLSELLGRHSAVSVPGLGYFEKVRIDGYYDESEAKFYPPRHQVRFKTEAHDDDTFAEYIARKKNISLASSKYFTEKFISKLKEDAAEGDFTFSDLGSFHTEHDQLVFVPNDSIGNDPSFYGYAPVGINKPAPFSASEPISPVFNNPAPQVDSPVVEEKESDIKQHYIEEEEEIKRTFNVWTILMAIVVVAAIAVFAAYKYDPSIFDRFNNTPPKNKDKNIVAKKVAVIPVTDSAGKSDSAGRAGADSVLKSTTTPAAAFAADTTSYDTLSQLHYVIRVVAVKKQKDADEIVKYYKSLGLDAKLQPRALRHKYKVIVGRYTSYEAAEAARRQMVKEKKITKDSQTIKINPKR